MRIKDPDLFELLNKELLLYSERKEKLRGIVNKTNRDVFIAQLIDSIRRVKFVSILGERDISKNATNPHSIYFDPIKAAIQYFRDGNIDEAYWLTFIFVHFGKNKNSGWRLARDIYGNLGRARLLTWERISRKPSFFQGWLEKNYLHLVSDGVKRSFGNHRKYETLDPGSSKNTAKVVESYINWIGPSRAHDSLAKRAIDEVGDDPRLMFSFLYENMDVFRFGRLAKFDYLTMVAKLGLINIEPGSTFVKESTGPLTGAKLLLYNDTKSRCSNHEVEDFLICLEKSLSLGSLGMQVLEDAICNWQKSPSEYKYFSG